jgi:hypothetical protein
MEDGLKNGRLAGFVPSRLEIKERPELNVFSLNVAFASYTGKNGKIIMGTALYEPDIESFKQEPDKVSMGYHNAYGGNCRLLIEYNPLKKSYLGQKFVNDKLVWESTGVEWRMFFFHFTMLGLSDGERCEFEAIN